MGLRTYMIRRTINSFVLVLAVVVFNFFLFRLPVFLQGVDPADIILGGSYFREDIKEQLRQQWNIPPENASFQDWFNHFWAYLTNMLTLNFGRSYVSRQPVANLIAEKLPNTVVLLGTASLFSILIGVVLGTLAAASQGKKIDMGMITASLSLYAIPIFFLGMIFILVFGSYLDLFPVSGGTLSAECATGGCSVVDELVDRLYHLVLPVSTLVVGGFGAHLILMRNNLADVLVEDYITTARAKGLRENSVLFNHAFRNAVLPMVTVIALTFATIIGGAVLTETIFSWNGLGRWILSSLLAEDWPASEAIFLLIAITVIVANFIADLLYGILDPRVKYT